MARCHSAHWIGLVALVACAACRHPLRLADGPDGGGRDANVETNTDAARPPTDAGRGPADAGTLDAGSLDAGSLDASAEGADAGAPVALAGDDCASLFAQVQLEDDFEAGSTEFEWAFAGGEFTGGAMVFPRDDSRFHLARSITRSFPRLFVCAIVHTEAHGDFNLGVRAEFGGVQLELGEDAAALWDVSELGPRIGTAPFVGSGARALRVVVWLDGDRTFGHVRDLESSASAEIRGRYFGDVVPLGVYVSTPARSGGISVDHVWAGEPTEAFVAYAAAE